MPCRTASLIKSGKLADLTVEDTQRNYKKALEKGVLKILSKMGISLLSCYHGAQIFEIYGLGQDIVDTAFRGSVSRIGGMTFDDLQKEVESFWVKVCSPYSNCALCAGSRHVFMMTGIEILFWVMLIVTNAGLLFRWYCEPHSWFCDVATAAAVVHCTIHATCLRDK